MIKDIFQDKNLFKKVNKYYSNEQQYNFWKNGFIKIPINLEQENKDFFLNLKKIYETRDNFFVKKKYQKANQFDFNGKIDDLDFCVNYLKKSKLIELMKFITCSNLVLTNINIRINQNIKKSHSFWGSHRDTTFRKDNSIKGCVPPLKHLIYYPNLNDFNEIENQLKIWVGSHRKMYSGYIDSFFSLFGKKIIIKTSNDSMTLFDGALKHAVGYTNNPKGNLRLIYSFLDKSQIFNGIEHQNKIEKWHNTIYEN